MMTPNLSKVARSSNPYLPYVAGISQICFSNQYAQFSPSCEHIFRLQKKDEIWGPGYGQQKLVPCSYRTVFYPRTLSTCFVRMAYALKTQGM